MAEHYLLTVKAARCGRVLEMATFSCMGLGGLQILKTFENLCVEMHSVAFLAHSTDFVRDNYIKNSIV